MFGRVPLIVAEIGINHNGDVAIAKELIDMAVECGCDAVKFQKRTIDIVYSEEELAKPRQSPWGTTVREQKEALEFGVREYDEIDRYCKEKKISWFASAWDLESIKFLRRYSIRYHKIASAMVTNISLLEEVAKERKHTFISTGMSTDQEIDRAVQIFRKNRCEFALLHCVSAYPCLDEECNLLRIKRLKEKYQCTVGYSGHEVGVLPSVIAVVLGAEVIERHITLDRAMYGSDQAASLEKRGLELLVRDARLVPVLLAHGENVILDKEKETARKLRYFSRSPDGKD